MARAAHAASPGVVHLGPESRVEAEEAQDAQVVLGDAAIGIADEADAVGGKIVDAAEEVGDCAARRVGVERVDGEVASGGVLMPVVGEGDHRVAPVRLDVAAQRCDLHDRTLRQGGDRAVGDAGRHRPDARSLQPTHHFLRRQRRGEVEVGDRQVQQRVPHRAADPARPGSIGTERADQLGQPRTVAPRGGGESQTQLSRRDRLTIIAAVAPQMRRSSHCISQ